MQRTDQLSRTETETASESAGLRSRAKSRAASVFSPKAFLFALVLSAVGLFAGGAIPFLGGVAGLVGVFAAGFALGIVTSTRRYLESTAAGAAVAGLGFLFDHLVFSLVGAGVPLVALGAGAGALAALVGHYFGRDLRAGLTRSL